MTTQISDAAETGLEVVDLYGDSDFTARRLHTHDIAIQMESMRRLTSAFVEHPDTLLQELVNAAIDMCGAESAGISIQDRQPDGEVFYHWVATAGKYASFLDAILPSTPSACGECIERGRPQIFRVTQRFFDIMGVNAPVVTDGVLIPWQVEDTHGTIWIMAHEREEAFDQEDCRMMELLASFAAMAVRQRRQNETLILQTKAAAAADMANDLAHAINNPLQSLTNILYLASQEPEVDKPQNFAQQASVELDRLSSLVNRLLALPLKRS
jgi:transcriptional regulator with GAF, ATPase, and Fis domain